MNHNPEFNIISDNSTGAQFIDFQNAMMKFVYAQYRVAQ